jgi:plastocyanin domain-containing protein
MTSLGSFATGRRALRVTTAVAGTSEFTFTCGMNVMRGKLTVEPR